jgi:Zn-dependent peptidase ImmA (M78 family)
VSDFSNLKCIYIPKHEIWEKADEFIKVNWNYGEIPVNIEYIVEAKVNLGIIPIQGLYDICGIDAYLKSDFSGIVIDNTKYNDERFDNRLRFSIAHELGHFILHDYLYEENKINISTSKDYYKFITNFPEKEYKSFEYQANQFAGRLLVPPKRLAEEVKKIYQTLEESNAVHLLEDYQDYVLDRSTPRLCKPFGVSEDVIRRRILEENLWPPKNHKS